MGAAGDREGRGRIGGRGPAAAVLAGAGFVVAAFSAVLWPFTVDDAFVAPRYARHLVQGLGLSFNPGEPAGTFTSPAWVLLAAGAWAAGLDPVPVLKGVGVAAALACLPGAYRLAGTAIGPGRPGPGARGEWRAEAARGRARRHGRGGGPLPHPTGPAAAGREPAAALLAPVLLAGSGPFLAWAGAGLETAAAALAVTVAADRALRGAGGGAGALLALAAFVRPELPILAPAFVLRLRGYGPPGVAARFLAAFLVPTLAVAAGRRWATGAWLPAAAAWKLGGIPDAPAIGPFLAGLGPALVLLALGALAVRRGALFQRPGPAAGSGGPGRAATPDAAAPGTRREGVHVAREGAVSGRDEAGGTAGAGAAVRFLALLIGLQAVAVGGAELRVEGTISTMAEYDRYFVPILPALAAAFAAAMARWAAPARGTIAGLLVAWNLVRPGAGPGTVVRESLARARLVAPAAAAVGDWLAQELPPAGAVAIGDVGLPSHGFSGRIVDLFGLHDVALRLPPSERAARILAAAPNAVVLVTRERRASGNRPRGDDPTETGGGGALEAYHRIERELLESPAFARDYRLAVHFRVPGNPWGYAVFRRRVR